MKKFVKFLVAMLVVAVVGVSFVSLAGCDYSNVLYVATNAEFPPFESVGKNGKIVGYDVDVIKAIATEIDMKVKFKNMPFDSIIGSIQTNENYIGVAGITKTPTREKQISFSKKYFTDDQYQVYVVKEGDTSFDGVTSKEKADAIADTKEVYSAMGQTGQFYVEGNTELGFDGLPNATSSSLSSVNECLEKLEIGKSIAIADVSVAKQICKEKPGYKVIDIKLTAEEYCIGVNKKNTILLEKINTAIDTLVNNGKIEEIRIKWLG